MAFCGAGIVEFLTSGKKKIIDVEDQESMENDMSSSNSPNVDILDRDKNELNISIKSIAMYKDLLDQGIITQEEFDAKKKQLLDL